MIQILSFLISAMWDTDDFQLLRAQPIAVALQRYKKKHYKKKNLSIYENLKK